MDSGIASDFIARRHGVFERAGQEVAKANRIGIGIPVLAELAFGIEASASRDRNMKSLRALRRARRTARSAERRPRKGNALACASGSY